MQALKDKQKKDYEKNVAIILKDIDSIKDNADFKKIKGYKTDENKKKGFTRLYRVGSPLLPAATRMRYAPCVAQSIGDHTP